MPATRRPKRRARRAYHHGDLRRALIAAALVLLKRRGPDALTLRAVAREAGVSQAAPYRHFRNRADLIDAVAEDGFTRLFGALRASVAEPVGSGGRTERSALQAIALAYVRFAMENSAHYRVMFARRPSGPPRGPARESVYALLRTGIDMLQARGLVRDGKTDALVLSCWSLVHGVAMLALDDQLAGSTLSPHDLAHEATELMMFGMAGNP